MSELSGKPRTSGRGAVTDDAFAATYADIKLIKTRKCVQLVFEIPQEDFDRAYEVLGGLPNPAAERWFGIAAIAQKENAQSVPTKEVTDVPEIAPQASPRNADRSGAKRKFRDMLPAQQAGIRCENSIFSAYLKERWPASWRESSEDAAECVRLICCVQSRSELNSNAMAKSRWVKLDDGYQAWQALERAI